jgi:hypothetical protein
MTLKKIWLKKKLKLKLQLIEIMVIILMIKFYKFLFSKIILLILKIFHQ